MRIAVEGCAHGELQKIYETLQGIEKSQNIKVDLLLCCGDFQASRNLEDLQTMAVPKKYQEMCTFYKYYSGELIAPVLTIFIGGNHEASNHLQELCYGGWVAPNIYYMGYAGVVRVNGIRIAGISGIYKGFDFLRGHHEFAPYTEASRKSVYHVRQLEVFRLKQLSSKIDIFMSHDWPRGICNYGNKAQLLRFKPHFGIDIENGQLGSRPCEDLLKTLQPLMWFAAHLHCKFAAVVPHDDELENDDTCKPNEAQTLRVTKFLALDKCLPKRRFLQVLEVDSVEYTDDANLNFEYDLEWLAILYLTNHLISVKSSNYYMPGPRSGQTEERYNFTPTDEELHHIREKFGDLKIPNNFCRTVEPYNPNIDNCDLNYVSQPKAQINPQSLHFCDSLGIDDPLSLAMLISGHDLSHSSTLDSSTTVLTDTSSLAIGDQSSLNASICETSTSPFKRKTSLTLPLPVAHNESDTSPTVETEKNPEELRLSDDEKSNGIVITDTSTPEKQNQSDSTSTKPPIKKFKRRNQSIYIVEDDNEATEGNE